MEREPRPGDCLDPELVPVDELADCAATVLAADGKRVLSYGTGSGYTPLRELIGQWFGVHPERVVLTNGSLQGLELLARRLPAGNGIVAEYPIVDRAQTALLRSGQVLHSVSLDDDGLATGELHQMLSQYLQPAAIYTIPSFHNPTGKVTSLERRRQLLHVVGDQNRIQTQQIAVIEDDAYGLTRFEGETVAALFDLSGKRTIYSSSFSATLAPGLRVGWLILPPELARTVATAANDTYISPVLLAQAVVFEYIQRGAFEAQVDRVRDGLRARRDALLDAIARHLPDAGWSRPQGGFFVWLQLPLGFDGRPLVERARVPFALPGTAFAWTSNVLRLSFGSSSPGELEAGIERLGLVYAETRNERLRPSSEE